MEYTLPTTAFVLKEVVTGRQPGAMVPQLPRVFPGRHRSDDRPKETALTIDRECWHTKSLQPFDTVLVLREDFFFHPWLGYGLDAPGRIEACLTQGTLNHRWITERFLAFMAGLPICPTTRPPCSKHHAASLWKGDRAVARSKEAWTVCPSS